MSFLDSLTSGVDSAVNGVVEPLSTRLSEIVFAEVSLFGVSFPWIVAWLVVAGAVFTIWFRGVQIRRARLALDLVRGKHSRSDAPGEVTHFQALTAAVSGTVGLGNIAGVAVAVTIGGPGATFWMVL